MANISLLERAKNAKFNLLDEIRVINRFIVNDNYLRDNFFRYVNDNWIDFPLRGHFLHLKELHDWLRKDVVDSHDDVYAYLGLAELLLNLLDFSITNDFHYDNALNYARVVFDRVEHILSTLGYEAEDYKGYIKIRLKDNVVEKVASIYKDNEIKWRILDFYGYKTTKQDKTDILLNVYREYEKARKSIIKDSNNEIYQISERVGHIMNTAEIRHGKNIQEKFKLLVEDENNTNLLFDYMLEILLHADNMLKIDSIK